MHEDITIAILVKDKEQTLPLYLECIENQSYPKQNIHLYVRSNNNRDNSVSILENWIEKNKEKYKSVYTDYSDAEIDISKYKNHEWNSDRFYVLGSIREQSVAHAIKNNSHYFVADCDNFIKPNTLGALVNTNLPVVAPYLQLPGKYYSNYHHDTDEMGYFRGNDQYFWIHDRRITGLIKVNVAHCTYYINKKYLQDIKYIDGSGKHEYVVFSDVCRKLKIDQYIDNRDTYGFISFIDDDNPSFNYNHYKSLIFGIDDGGSGNEQDNMSNVFTNIYENNVWGGSGIGSKLEVCEPLISMLEEYIRSNDIKTMVDIGCGDMQWMPSLLNKVNIKYTGIDIVNSVIEKNKENHPDLNFINSNICDIDIQNMPDADLFFIKDVLQHWTSDVVEGWVNSFFAAKPNARLIVANCSHQHSDERHLKTGGFAPLNGDKFPLNKFSPKELLSWDFSKKAYQLSI
jgi:hypothetical protein